jgi:hypothetical protein
VRKGDNQSVAVRVVFIGGGDTEVECGNVMENVMDFM